MLISVSLGWFPEFSAVLLIYCGSCRLAETVTFLTDRTAPLGLPSSMVCHLLEAATTHAQDKATATARALIFTHTLLQRPVGSHLLAHDPQAPTQGSSS